VPKPPAQPTSWEQLQQQEREALRERRLKVVPTLTPEQADPAQPVGAIPRIGLALSGGGVRSATFALGLLRGLAQSSRPRTPPAGTDDGAQALSREGLLGRLDYLSSVSGGGYVAAMLGRLIQKPHTSPSQKEDTTPDCGLLNAQNALGHHDSPVLDWLRRNGRYLSPGGSRDIGMVAVTYLRALLAIHMEFMVFCMLLGLIVIAPHLWQYSTVVLSDAWQGWYSPWMALAAAAAMGLAPGLVAGYWYTRDAPDASHWPDATQALPWLITLGLLSWVAHMGNNHQMWGRLYTEGPGAHLVLTIMLSSVWLGQTLTGIALALPRMRKAGQALATAELRNWLTRALYWTGQACLGLIALGLLDSASWWLLRELLVGSNAWWGGIGAGGVGVLLLRSFAQPLQQLAADTEGKAKAWLPRLLNLVSAIGLLSLVMAWLVTLQWFVFAPDGIDALRMAPPWMRACLIFLGWASWVLLTSTHEYMPNSTSLHAFYRARLTRAYLAVGNPKRLPWFGKGKELDVRTVVGGDDALMAHYAPEKHGGPIHLINTCLNETRDSDSNLYNADRKGCLLTVTSRGMEVGPAQVHPHVDEQSAGTVGRWVAISGAAASPGAGSYTTRGLALLLYFLGIRLGFWIKSPIATPGLKWLSQLGWRCLPKPLMLSCEATATFMGQDRPWWYLSDGGHFDNTGVYPLVKRELDFIILSDASSDPNFQFGDIENMVRKVRIDFGADIDFYTADEAARLFTLAGPDMAVLSPEGMGDSCSSRGVLLARIRYRERPDPKRPGHTLRPEGTLLVIKPNLHNALNVDVLAYAERNPTFPHESTADQFFDEAQWESYHRLGEDMGLSLSEPWLAQLPGWRSPARHATKVSARLRAAAATPAQATAQADPIWKRSARSAAIKTTLGLGASGTLLLSGWQIVDDMNARQKDARAQARELFVKVGNELQGFDRQCKPIPESVANQAESLMLDLVHSPLLSPLDKGGVERMSARILQGCHPAASVWRTCPSEQAHDDRQALCAALQRSPSQDNALSYWTPPQTPDEQQLAAHKILAQWVPSLVAPVDAMPSTQVAQAHLPAQGGATPLARAVTPTAVPSKTQPHDADFDAILANAPATAGMPISPQAAPASALPALSAAAKLCQDQGKPVLYIQIYDEASRAAAEDIRRQLSNQAPLGPWVTPLVDNVVRRAAVRQQSSPVPWPRPTILVSSSDDLPCAREVQAWLSTPANPAAARPGEHPTWPEVWIRRIPAKLGGRLNVYELWLPPTKAISEQAKL
jgi:hypothetical protein